ncbi:hypothetical protein ACQEVZ_41040 [Dactylosporangium sp. CA-152071]
MTPHVVADVAQRRGVDFGGEAADLIHHPATVPRGAGYFRST